MARNKQNQKQKKDGNHRKESREERKARIESQRQAREACQKILPLVTCGILVFILLFGLYVRSIPTKETFPSPSTATVNKPPSQSFEHKVKAPVHNPMIQEALKEAADILNRLDADKDAVNEL